MVVGDVTPPSCCSPNFEKNPLFLGLFCSSFSPTSSNPSSAVGGCLSKRRSPTADRGSLGNRAESRDWRPVISVGTAGDLADISYKLLVHQQVTTKTGYLLTNDRLYESNDSREMENGSNSPTVVGVVADTLEALERRPQNPFFSGGEGLRESQWHSSLRRR